MASDETPTWAGSAMALLSLLVMGASATQVALAWPFPARNTGPALLALSIHGALVLAFLAGDLWRMAAQGGGQTVRQAVAVAAVLAAWAGIWLGARYGLLVLAAGHVLLALYRIAGSRRDRSISGSGIGLFCAFNAAALAVAAWLGPFG